MLLLSSTNKAIRSAESVAALRAASAKHDDLQMKNPDFMAKYFVGPRYKYLLCMPHRFLRKITERISPGSYCYFLARTKFFDEKLYKAIHNGIEQLVILGAGYDTRAHRFHEQLKHIDIFELDLESTQKRKKKILKRKRIGNALNVQYIKFDFKDRNIKQCLTNNGFSIQKKTLFILEGVSYYLPEEDLKHFLRFFSNECCERCELIFDYAERSFLDKDFSSYGSYEMSKWLEKHNERFLFGLHRYELLSWLKQQSIKLLSNLSAQDIKQSYLVNPSGRSAGQPLGYLNFAHVSNSNTD